MEPTSTLKDFTVIERLGEGSFACVYKVQRNDDKKLYAMKKVFPPSFRLKSAK